ncbi:hypothetical protein NESM_000469400 [Novymonas esmeraldas]|uniref:Uncharacterized protein n=1 Tax=Novymonas esmeraldas TaxID=1808958 RepID=A0AAW0EMZ1_9TRYP
MNSSSNSADSYTCHVADRPRVPLQQQHQQYVGYPAVAEGTEGRRMPTSEALSHISVSSPIPAYAQRGGSGGDGGGEGKGTVSAAALLSAGAGGVDHRQLEELSPTRHRTATAPHPLIDAVAEAETVSARETHIRTSDPTQAPEASQGSSSATHQHGRDGGAGDDFTSLSQPTPSDNARVHPTTFAAAAASTSQPHSPPAHVMVHRYAPEPPSGPAWGAAPGRPHRAVQHEVLPPVPIGSRNKYDLLSVGSTTAPRATGGAAAAASSTSMPRSAVAASNVPFGASTSGSTSAVVAIPREVSTVAVQTNSAAARDLVSHVDRNSFGFELREMFQRLNFADVPVETHRVTRDTPALEECRRLFRVIAKNKDVVDVGDMHELLVIFTPCGVSLREGADFLWEDCGGKSSLAFRDFVQYGPVLRARLLDYELFQQLSDRQKLLVTHARVVPGEPPEEANTARLGLLRVADQQAQNKLPRFTRPLRLYEEIFLVDYQERLHDAALIPASEVPTQSLTGDYTHEQQQHRRTSQLPTLPRLSVPVLLKEDMEWRNGDEVYASDSESSNAAARAAAADDDESPTAVRHGGTREYPTATQGGRRVKGGEGTGKAGGSRTASKGRSGHRGGAAASGMGTSGLYGDSGRRAGHRQQRQQPQKNMGRFVEEEYWERRTMDDHLITQLQSLYTAP